VNDGLEFERLFDLERRKFAPDVHVSIADVMGSFILTRAGVRGIALLGALHRGEIRIFNDPDEDTDDADDLVFVTKTA
jgi:hypothetical protein